jgi:hypothetical protein
MNKPQNPHQTFLQFMLRAQGLARQDARSDKGYAMLMTSVISIAMLSMLAAYTTMTNLSKSSTNAYVDGTNSFYAAESGLNKRAQEFREKFANYINPSGTVPGSGGSTAVSAANIVNCFSISVNAPIQATQDFECRNYPFKYNNNIASVNAAGGGTVLGEQDNNSNTSNYVAHTFVAPKQNYATTPPSVMTVPSGETYAGLKALEYQYTVYATATKINRAGAIAPTFTPEQTAAKTRVVKETGDAALIVLYDAEQARVDALNNTSAATNSGTNSVLQMNFRSRVVPLFQFAVFYDGDLEMTSTSPMTIGGRVHTNANLYLQPSSNAATPVNTSFLSTITTLGSIYNRVDSVWNGATLTGISRVLMTGADCTVATNCTNFVANSVARNTSSDPFTATQLAAFGGRVKDGVAGVVRLNTPPPGFLRKRNYHQSWTGNAATTTNNSGNYYAKADMRLEMVPDRDTNTTATPWTRNQAIIPFNFTSITTGGTGTCTTTLPAKDPATGGVPTLANDPGANYIDPDRNNPRATGTLLNNLHCNEFTKGQLQSLRQPVMVLTDINQPATGLRTLTGATPAAGSEAAILGRPTTFSALVLPTGLSTASAETKGKILRALQVAIVSTSVPIQLDTLGTTRVNASAFSATFSTLIDSIPALTATNRTDLLAATPNAIAALGNAWFLPAPIQRIESNNLPADANNTRRSGFYDGRERRWITMLQTNIASLSVWNRDGLYVEASDLATDLLLRSPYVTTNTLRDAAFNSGDGANFTDGLAFDRAITIPATPKGLQALGLGSVDTTEGGLVLHATVGDDLDGDNVMSALNDVSLDVANPIKKRDAVGNLIGTDNNPVTASNPEVIIDYPRKYRGGTSIQSPFGFAFNGGNYLPGALTLVTDQPIYVQGDFNNNGAAQSAAAPSTADGNRLPASIIGDVITVLSNECVAANSAQSNANILGVPAGQIRCGLPRVATGAAANVVNITAPVGNVIPAYRAESMTVNAAFLSNTDRSVGNLGVGRGWASTGTTAATNRHSGSINNYFRMLEDWGGATGRYFNYTGSFVSLDTPIEASGRYVGGGFSAAQGYYNIPQRNFNFDIKFNNFDLLPPLPPRAVYLQQEVFKRNYN